MFFNETTARESMSKRAARTHPSMDAYYREIDERTKDPAKDQGRPSPTAWRVSDAIGAAIAGGFFMWVFERLSELLR